jgi:hypothetical protein
MTVVKYSYNFTCYLYSGGQARPIHAVRGLEIPALGQPIRSEGFGDKSHAHVL